MDIYSCQEAFGASDKTTAAMRQAISRWFSLYYRDAVTDGEDPCQRIAYTVVGKLVRGVFGEYQAQGQDDFSRQVISALDAVKEMAVQQALVGGESYLKPWPQDGGFGFTVIPRDRVLIFGRDARGEPTDVGTMEVFSQGNAHYTLLERRQVDPQGYLTIENRLYRSFNQGQLGTPVPLSAHPAYAQLPERYTYTSPVGSVGLVRLKTPMLNCVDGSAEGVSVYAAAERLIRAIDRNEYLLCEEFERGQSRVFASADLLQDGKLQHSLFLGLDEDPDKVGITLFSPQLREQSFLARKQEYLRNVETLIGIKRGLLCDVNLDQRTATEISASQTDHALTVMDFQNMWHKALQAALTLCVVLGRLYGMQVGSDQVQVDWGNGVLYDEEKRWQDYKDMVAAGLLSPEVALGWRFGMAADTPQQRKAIAQRYMP